MALPNSVRRMFWIVCAGMLLQVWSAYPLPASTLPRAQG